MKIHKLAVFCGSHTGQNPLFIEHTNRLAGLIAKNKVELVYGGGKKGLMGVVADAVMEQRGIVRGVIPQLLIDWESQHEAISELVVVEDMHIRKRKLYELCDAAVILPGGFGTLDEFFEILTWNQLSIHDKQIFLMNSGGFYDHLLEHMKSMEQEGFLYGKLEEKFVVLTEPEELEFYL